MNESRESRYMHISEMLSTYFEMKTLEHLPNV